MSTKPERVLLGRIGRAQGLKGEVRLTSFTQDPLAIASYGPLDSEDGRRSFEIDEISDRNGVIVARLKGVRDRSSAEALVNEGLWLPRERLKVETAEDEFLQADLIGCAVVTADGEAFGTVSDIPNYGAGDLVEIARPGAASVLLPFTRAFVPEIDISAKRVVVVIPEGLIEDETL